MPNVVFDASTVVSATIKADSVPERALRQARANDTLCFSSAVEGEIREVLSRPKFRRYYSEARRQAILDLLIPGALTVEPAARVTDCRDAKDNKYLELALAAGADIIVSSDDDLLVLDPWRGIRILTPAQYVLARGRRDDPVGP
jgi:putative PIN family toxin of toxin-antitoxin system